MSFLELEKGLFNKLIFFKLIFKLKERANDASTRNV